MQNAFVAKFSVIGVSGGISVLNAVVKKFFEIVVRFEGHHEMNSERAAQF